MSDFDRMRKTATAIIDVVEQKDKDYGSSWKKRGGSGAFMVMSRKWDRIETMCSRDSYDIFRVLGRNDGDVLDDVKDLIGYLHLIMDELKPAVDADFIMPAVPNPGTPKTLLLNSEEMWRGVSPVPPMQVHPSSKQFMEPPTENELFQNEGYYGDGSMRLKCRACRKDVVAIGLEDAEKTHVCMGVPARYRLPS